MQLALDVLEAVAEADGEIGVTEIAARLELRKGTIFPHLQTLTDRGYLSQHAGTARYRLGMRSHLLGLRASDQVDLVASSEDAIRKLREETGQTVVLSTVEPSAIVVLVTSLGKSPLEIGVRPGSRLPLHASAQGKVALAFEGPRLLKLSQAKAREKFTGYTHTDLNKMAAEFEVVRREGWAGAPQEMMLGINAIAAPIFDQAGLCVGTIALVGSIQFIPPKPDPKQLAALRAAGAAISKKIGYEPQPGGLYE